MFPDRQTIASRVVLDAATQMLTHDMELDELRHTLYKLAVRFKTLGITSMMTLETPSLFFSERVTDLGLSPVADNLLMLRYTQTEGRLAPTLTIVKTRGTDHDRRAHGITIAAGGMRVGPSVDKPPQPVPGGKKRPLEEAGSQ